MAIFDLTPNSIKLLITKKGIPKGLPFKLKAHEVQMYFVLDISKLILNSKSLISVHKIKIYLQSIKLEFEVLIT